MKARSVHAPRFVVLSLVILLVGSGASGGPVTQSDHDRQLLASAAIGLPEALSVKQSKPAKGAKRGFTPPSLPRPIVRASDFGSIQAAIDSLGHVGGSVHLGTGTHEISSAVKLRSNVTLFGDGIGKTILKVENAARSNGIVNATLGDQHGPGESNMGVRDLTVQGNGIRSGDCCFGVKLSGAEAVLLFNVAVHDAGLDGIYVGLRIIRDPDDRTVIVEERPSQKIRISGCDVHNSNRNGISFTNVSLSIVEGCTVSGNGFGGIVLEPDQTIQSASTGARLNFGNLVVGNTVLDSGVGILLFSLNRDFDRVILNAVCSNRIEQNERGGIFDGSEAGHNSFVQGNFVVKNQLKKNGAPAISLLPSAQTKGNAATNACTLPPLFVSKVPA